MDANAAMKRCGEWKPQERRKKYCNNNDDTQQLRRETTEDNKMWSGGKSCRCSHKAEAQWQRHKDDTKNKATTVYCTTAQSKNTTKRSKTKNQYGIWIKPSTTTTTQLHIYLVGRLVNWQSNNNNMQTHVYTRTHLPTPTTLLVSYTPKSHIDYSASFLPGYCMPEKSLLFCYWRKRV